MDFPKLSLSPQLSSAAARLCSSRREREEEEEEEEEEEDMHDSVGLKRSPHLLSAR